MAITSSAKRAIRVSEKKRTFNLRRLETMRNNIKTIKKAAPAKNKSDVQKSLALAYQAIDKAAKRGVIKKNTAARKKSRLSKFLKNQQVKK